jgi:Matrixin
MTKKIGSLALCACMLLASAAPASAGGNLDDFDLTGFAPSPIPGQFVARVVGIHWDTRQIPVQFTMNTSLDPIPNSLNLSAVRAQAALQASLDTWNNIPTSFIEMNIKGTTTKVVPAGFDQINELTFGSPVPSFALAISVATTLSLDLTFVEGLDIDGDGDSDVSADISTAADVDGDGDIELPAGFYKAGTILDNDVLFRTDSFHWTDDPLALNGDPTRVDLMSIATHELGHAHGLSHSTIDQLGDGAAATMFPFPNFRDPDVELSQRSLSADDIAWSSYLYPEGTAASGPAALQPGDIAFNSVYGLIKGELRHGVLNQPIAGGSVSAIDWDTNTVISGGYSGHTQFSADLATGQLLVINDPAFHIRDGEYVIPVPKGSYAVGVEALDGFPISADRISNNAFIGALFGQQNFNEEFYNGNREAGREPRLGQRQNISVRAGQTRAGINIVTADSININNFGSPDFTSYNGVPPGFYYAVRVPKEQLQAIIAQTNSTNPGHDVLAQAMAFHTAVSIPGIGAPSGATGIAPVFAEATLTTGTSNGATATLNMATPLARVTGFAGQHDDFSPLYFQEPQDLGRRIRDGIASGAIQNLFMVLRLPTTPLSNKELVIFFDGGAPNNDAPILGLSYYSFDGATFFQDLNFNYRFSLILSGPVTPPGQQ